MDAGISSILVFLTSSISLLSIWWLKPQKMRIVGMATSITSLFYQISIKNWAGLLEIVVICSNILSFAKYRKSRGNSLYEWISDGSESADRNLVRTA